jgi:hypothetical protein
VADYIAAEISRSTQRPLAAADPDLLDVCHTEHITVVPLSSSDGTTWNRRPER